MNPSLVEIIATCLFGVAVLHTFLVSVFEHLANRFPEGSIAENLLHFLGEVEVVFGIWAAALIVLMVLILGSNEAFSYVESLNFREPLFVFAIMAVASTRPVVAAAEKAIFLIARLMPLGREIGIYLACLTMGPLLGSFITEPAAMTVTALILRERYFLNRVSERFKYLTLGILFVNVSIGGVLTPFAAPPVLMVAKKWGWDTNFMMKTFGWKAVLGVILNALLGTWILRKDLSTLRATKTKPTKAIPLWLTIVHFCFLTLIVLTAHHLAIFIGLFLFFLGVTAITREFQDDLKLRESLLVSFFLGGLVILGGLQEWWLSPIIRDLDAFPLFLGATTLTAITDNAALTFLGSQIEDMSATFKYALVAGAISGGGLSVIANAPNPAGFAILQDCFGSDRIRPLGLVKFALVPTLIAMACFWYLP